MIGTFDADDEGHESAEKGCEATRETAGSEVQQTQTVSKDIAGIAGVDITDTSAAQQPKPLNEVEKEREAMMRVLNQGDALLWNNPIGWDVMVVCGFFSWRLHRQILDRCEYFASRIEPWQPCEGDEREYYFGLQVIPSRCLYKLELNSHDPGQLANVLRFLYTHDYPGALYCISEPLYADCLLTNTAMFLAAASVACGPMMDYAGAAITRYTSFLQMYLTPAVFCDTPSIDYAVLKLAIPLRRALTILYEQPSALLARAGDYSGDHSRDHDENLDSKFEEDGILWPLRQMFMQFVTATLPQLALNPAFHAQFSSEWDGQMFMRQLEADLADLAMDEAVEGKGKEKEGQTLSRAHVALSLLHRLASTEREWIAGVLKHCDRTGDDEDEDENDDGYDSSSKDENRGEDCDHGRAQPESASGETEVVKIVQQPE